MFLKTIKIINTLKFYRLKNIFVSALVTVATIIIVLSSLAFLTGCEKITDLKNGISYRFNNERQSDAAVAAVNQFFNFIILQDYDSAYELVYTTAEVPKTLEDFKKDFLSVTKIVSIEINWVEVKNNIAIVGIDMIDIYDSEEKIYKDIEISLIKDENDSWKINFWSQ